MRHARAAALDRLEPLLRDLRRAGGLTERSRGVFYRRSRAFLHFHEHGAALFADIRSADGQGFDRLRVDEPRGAEALMARVKSGGS